MLNSKQIMFISLLIAMGSIDQACHRANMGRTAYYNRLDVLLHNINFDKAKKLMGTRIKPYFVINPDMDNILKKPEI